MATDAEVAGAAVLRLTDTVDVVPVDDGVRFVRGSECLRVRGPARPLADVGSRLAAGIPAAALTAFPQQATLPRVLARLRAIGWITTEPVGYGAGTAVERQVGYLTMFGPNAVDMQSRITRARVGVLGVGGVGGIVAQHLVGAGLRALWLVDHDTVQMHNLNRQFLFGHHDIGSAKTVATAAALTRLAPDIEVRTADRLVHRPGDLDCLPTDLDLLLVAADTPADLTAVVWSWAAARDVPVCLGAVGLETGYWGPLLIPKLGHCWHCFENRRTALLTADDVELEQSSDGPTPFSFGPVNTVISAMIAYDVVRYLATGWCRTLNSRGRLDFPAGRIEFLDGAECTCTERSDG